VHVDGQSFPPIGLHKTDTASYYLLIIKQHWPIKDDNDQFFAELAISFIFAAVHTL
jgi:hypothetical protein